MPPIENEIDQIAAATPAWPKGLADLRAQLAMLPALSPNYLPGAAPAILPGDTAQTAQASAPSSGLTGDTITGDPPGSVPGSSITPGTISSLTPFANTVRPVLLVTALPALPDPGFPPGSFVYKTTDVPSRLYKNVANAWVAAIGPSDIQADSITAGQIAAGAIGATEIAAGAVSADKMAANSVTVGSITRHGANLIDDSSFEIAPVGGFDANVGASTAMQPYWQSATVGLVQYATSVAAKTGTHLLRVVGNGVGTYPNLTSYFIPVQPGRTYRLSAWMTKYSGAVGLARVALPTYDKSQTLVSNPALALDQSAANVNLTYYEGTWTCPTNSTVSYVRIQALLTGTPTSGDIAFFEDIQFEEVPAAATNTSGEVVIDSSGVTVTNGKITVTNGGGTVVIDGTSNMFKIAASGTQSGSIAANAKLAAVETSLAGLGSLSESPAHVCFFTGNATIGNSRLGPGHTYSYGVQDGANRFVATASGAAANWRVGGTTISPAWAYTRLTSIGTPSVPIVGFVADNADTVAHTCYQRYYVFREAAF